MLTCQHAPCSTPANIKPKLFVASKLIPNHMLYQSLTGELQYLTFTHFNIAYIVQQVCLFTHAHVYNIFCSQMYFEVS